MGDIPTVLRVAPLDRYSTKVPEELGEQSQKFRRGDAIDYSMIPR